MSVRLLTAGVTVEVDTAAGSSGRWRELVHEACAGHGLDEGGPSSSAPGSPLADVLVTVTQRSDLGPSERHHLLTRGAWTDGREVILQDACSSGIDLVVRPLGDRLEVVARPRPGWRHRALGLVAPDRQVLLHRAVLLQYPALWWSGVLGRVPLHVSAATVDGFGVVLAGPGGVGKSTLIATLDASTGAPVSDNLCTTDGIDLHGLLEPSRTDSGSGRRMPHGRRESVWSRRDAVVRPDGILVLRRGFGQDLVVRVLEPAETARELVGGTYAAGELRRYWAFAATLALGTGRGPAHPPVADLARVLAETLPAWEVLLPARPGVTLRDVVSRVRAFHPVAGEEAWRP